MGRVNETQTHGDAPKFPFPPLPGPGGWWPGTVSVIRAASLRYFDVRSRKWSMRKGTKTRFVVRREGPHPPLPWWIENTIFCEVLWVSARLRAHVPSAGRPLPPAPSALKPACELGFYLVWSISYHSSYAKFVFSPHHHPEAQILVLASSPS